MDLLTRFIKHIHQQHLFTKNDRLLLAVSGGVDSVVLGQLCKEAGFDFGVAHCNFQLRGAESDADEDFVRRLAAQWGMPFYTIRFNTESVAAENKQSIQEAARKLRYEWFGDIKKRNGFDYVLTAHHANDNIETLLMSFFRGTGINGLTGIREKNDTLIRPLLFAKRVELETFLAERALAFVQDASNLKDVYTRNFFRNRLLPQIATVFPEVENNLIDNIQRFKDVQILYDQSVERHKKKLLEIRGEEVHIPVLLLQQNPAPAAVLFEIIREYGFGSRQVSEVLALLTAETGRFTSSSTHRVIRNRKHLIIAPLQPVENARILLEKPGRFLFSGGILELQLQKQPGSAIPTSPATAWVDARRLQFPLTLRPWKTGDYFYPLGMQKKKKLSRFLIDQKLSAIEKEKVWVLETQQKIVWIVGYRLDDRFKVTDSTSEIIEIKLIDRS